MLSTGKKTSSIEDYEVERTVLREFIDHMFKLGQAIKITYYISETDGISMLRDVLTCFLPSPNAKFNLEIDSNEAKEVLRMLFKEDLGCFIAKLSTSIVDISRHEISSKLRNYRISEKTNSLLAKISGVDYNDIVDLSTSRGKLAVLSSVLVMVCERALGVYGK
ncbi:MAG: hypothetical protein DRO23_05100 [Thermoprotei archaeon]|nr:MAG: hypothetical protein DRO23_05100 [Thermoprotei archaeon]